MPIDLTATYGDKLEEVATQQVVSPPPDVNVVHACLPGIDGTGSAALVSRVKQGDDKYEGFALVLKHDADVQNFEWLQFITRQLVSGNTAKTGSLVTQTNTVAYQLVDSADEIRDYTLTTGPKPSNWNTCWKVDASVKKPFYGDVYEYAMSVEKGMSAILDSPSPTIGKIPPKIMEDEYNDLPLDVVDVKTWVDSQGPNVTARAYFSDYLLKKDNQSKYRILARFDFYLTWNAAKSAQKKDYTLRSVISTNSTTLLECHKAALLHKVTKRPQPFKNLHDMIS
jgi:hypothetical protein